MAINFNALPDNKPAGGAIPTGKYVLTIEKAEMKAPKDTTKRDYLNITYIAFNAQGEQVGRIWDILSESESSYVQYKIKRFITALGLTNLTSFELKDLAKIIIGKQLIADVVKKEEEGKPAKSEVDIFSDEIYYPMEDFSKIFNIEFEEVNADDGADIFNKTDENDTQY